MAKNPWMKWYPGDWRSDPLLRACEPVSRYVWLEMLGLMHEAEPYGHLILGGRAMDYKTLSRVIAVDAGEVKRAVKELEDRGVFSRTEEGVIYSRRMIRDKNRSEVARNHGLSGGNPSLINQTLNQPTLKGQDMGHDKPQKLEARSQTPPNPHRGSGSEGSNLVDRLIAAAKGNVVHNASGIEILKPILDLQAMGCDLEADILPAIAERVPGMPDPLRTWGARFLRDAVLARQAARMRLRGSAPTGPIRAIDPKSMSEDDWDRVIRYWNDTGNWSAATHGPPPGSVGCLAPEAVTSRYVQRGKVA